MPLPLDTEFDRLLTTLEDWYADGVQAQSYDGPTATSEHGHAILHKAPYPGLKLASGTLITNPRAAWRRASPMLRGEMVHALENELYGLSHGPSQASPGASGLHPGTLEWRRAVAGAEGSLRAVARRFGTSHTTVRALRLEAA